MPERLFHISEDPAIAHFSPRPSPSHFDEIRGDVVFAVGEKLLHNYLLPRDCPRVTFYCGANTSLTDRKCFLNNISASYVVAIEGAWLQTLRSTTLYCYELPSGAFELLDECAAYYISYASVAPISVTRIDDILGALAQRGVELRLLPSLWPLADAVLASTLQYSLIRMRNAAARPSPAL